MVKAFGLDFGTSKTALAFTFTGTVNPHVQDVRLGQDLGRTATCVLRERSSGEVAIGNAAEEEFLRLGYEGIDRKGYTFEFNFKPHIHHPHPEMRENARLFLHMLAQMPGVQQELESASEEVIVVAGYPVAWDDAGARTLAEILREAGFPEVLPVPEPVGAAFFFLARNIKARDLRRDVLIIDWGAGTLDFTVMRAGKIETKNTWGSALYGGRLFDDLFFQWICDAVRSKDNLKDEAAVLKQRLRESDLEKALASESDRFYLKHKISRDVKEAFSDYTKSSDRKPAFIYTHGIQIPGDEDGARNLGTLKDATPTEFERRARNYTASEDLRMRLSLSQKEAVGEERELFDRLLRGEQVDLLEWSLMLVEGSQRALKLGEGPVVILTGGSTNWGWFYDLIRAHPSLGGRVYQDHQPELSIARGLARAYVIGCYSAELRQKIGTQSGQLLGSLSTEVYPKHLSSLVNRLSEGMQSDGNLRANVYNILRRMAVPGPADKASIREALNTIFRDWLAAPKNSLEVRGAAEAFAHAAFRDTMEMLKREVDPNIGGLLEVAIEACSVEGEHRLAELIQRIANGFNFDPGLFELLLKGLKGLWQMIVGKPQLSQAQQDKEYDDKAAALTDRLFADLARQIEQLVRNSLGPDKWAKGILEQTLEALDTIIEMSRVRTMTPPGDTVEETSGLGENRAKLHAVITARAQGTA